MHRSGQCLLDSLNEMACATNYREVAEAAIRVFRNEVKGDYYSVCSCQLDYQKLEILHPEEGWLKPGAPVLKALNFLRSEKPDGLAHPSVIAFEKSRKPAAYIRSQLMPDCQWIKSAHYQVVDRQLGIRDMASIFLYPEPGRLMILNCGRGKPFPAREMETVSRMERIMSLLLAGRSVEALKLPSRSVGSATAGLTPREMEILHWVREGKRNSEIAVILDISSHTVRKHLENIFRKLGVETRSGAAKAMDC